MPTAKIKDAEPPHISKKQILLVGIAFLLVFAPLVYWYTTSSAPTKSPRAAIVDQLGSSKLGQTIRHENQSFIEAARILLQARFSEIDYYLDNATVDQYRKLASQNYKLIVWRAHSAIDVDSAYVAVCTVDKYGTKNYDGYLDNDLLTLCNITGDSNLYFGITPKFIEQLIEGEFQDTVIMLMSCNGLNPEYVKTAEALTQKGVKAVVSWDNWVSPLDNDNVAHLLLEYLIRDNETIGTAVSRFPVFLSDFGSASLEYLPDNQDVREYRIPTYKETGYGNPLREAALTVRASRKDELPNLERSCTRRTH